MNQDYQQQQPVIRSQTGLGAFYGKVYAFMAGALALSGLTSYVLINFFQVQFMTFLVNNSFAFFGLWIAELALVVVLGVKGMKNPTIAVSGFLAYSILNGITLSVTFLMYTQQSIISAFAVTAVTFGAMAAFGIITKKDLSGMGYAAMSCLIGIIIVMVVNLFLRSNALVMFASIAMVLIFSGLTAYDNQKIKQFYLYSDDGVSVTGIAVFCALQLYLDFINLFLAFLRIFGKNN